MSAAPTSAAAIFPQPCMNLVYTVGRRTSAGSSTVRHIATAADQPLCWSTKHGSAKSFNGGLVRDTGAPTCKHCAKIAEQQRQAVAS
jgi:hypothetical protein